MPFFSLSPNKAFFKSLLNSEPPKRKPAEDDVDENSDEDTNAEYRPLTRDSYNLHKMIVVVTSVGKVG